MNSTLWRIADDFIPAGMRLDSAARRRVLLFLISHTLGPAIGLAILAYLRSLDPRAGFVLAIPAAALAAFWLFPWLLKATGQFVTLSLLSVQNLAFIVLFVSYHYGGLSSPFLSWLITVPMLAFFYLGEDGRLRTIALIGFAADLMLFYAAHSIGGPFQSRVPLDELSTIGLFSVFCAGLYVTMMAFYYGRILASKSELEREVQRHRQTAVMLVEAKEAAESANRVQSEFLAAMTHELRTPLNAVIGFSERMASEEFGPLGHRNYRNYAKDIHDSGTTLLRVISDILEISKAEAGSMKLDEALQDCAALVLAACRPLRARMEKANLTLQLDLPEFLPQLYADGRMVRQIVSNLLGNAVKFTPAGGRIAIEARAEPARGLTLTVRDTGIGIAAADLARVRKPFTQGGSASEHRAGAGLGLPLADMMIREHGGVLELDSEPGRGTTARVIFPPDRLAWPHLPQPETLRAADAADAQIEEALLNRPASNRPQLLIVEDDPNLGDLISRMLERCGFVTAIAADGQRALKHLATDRVDLVITDMVMPDMDGIELMRVLREERPSLPVIALSGVEDYLEYRRIALHMGARMALRKPINRGDLVRAVNDVLARRRVSELDAG